jgi:hypothetical protein
MSDQEEDIEVQKYMQSIRKAAEVAKNEAEKKNAKPAANLTPG